MQKFRYVVVMATLGLILFIKVKANCINGCQCMNSTVNCSGRNLPVIPSYDLFNFPVEHLNMSHNSCKDVTISGYDSLKNLSLAYNKIINIPALDTSLLEYLDLSGNRLTEIKSTVFEYVPRLETLLLSNNHIANIQEASFLQLKDLRKLDLSYNNLNRILGKTFRSNEKLEFLSLKNNSILSLSNSTFQQQKHLQHLDVSENKLSSIPHDIFGVLRNLRWLSISNNRITDLHNGAFTNLREVRYLNLTGNNIAVIKYRTFQDCEDLENLSLSYNNIGQLDSSSFYGLVRMKSLDLSFNKISSLSPEVFYGFPEPGNYTLRYLNLKNNSINCFSEDYRVSTAGNNQGFLNYKVLDTLKELEILDISFNMLTKFNVPSVLRLKTTSIKIILKGNPWNCTCEAMYYAYMKLRNTTSITPLQCYSPEEMRNQSWHVLDEICRPTIPPVSTEATKAVTVTNQTNVTTETTDYDVAVDETEQKPDYAPRLGHLIVVIVLSVCSIVSMILVNRCANRTRQKIDNNLWWEDAVTRKDLLSE